MFDFSPLKRLITDAGSQIRGRSNDLENLKRERDLIAAAPLSKADTIRALHARIDDQAAGHLKILSGTLQQMALKGDPGRVVGPILCAQRPNMEPSFSSFEAALNLALSAEMKGAISRIVETLQEWPEGAIDHADKVKRLDELDRKIGAAEAELGDLVQQARSAGINV